MQTSRKQRVTVLTAHRPLDLKDGAISAACAGSLGKSDPFRCARRYGSANYCAASNANPLSGKLASAHLGSVKRYRITAASNVSGSMVPGMVVINADAGQVAVPMRIGWAHQRAVVGGIQR